MFILGSTFMGACMEMTQLSFIQYRNFPGGPSEYENVEFSIPVDEAGNVAFILTNWCADALIVWRCAVIYRGGRVSPWVTASLPCAMYLAELVLGPGHASHYTGVAAMIVESAALYSAFTLLFIIPFGMGNPIANTFLQALSEVQIIAPFLIIYRVTQGKGWSATTSRMILTEHSRAKSGDVILTNLARAGNWSNIHFAAAADDSGVSEEAAEGLAKHGKVHTPEMARSPQSRRTSERMMERGKESSGLYAELPN
ncbi:uncharacterized protein LAESUDRAFT_762120 [Laetiporus sulphureus 93-53]|uniref:Uncharacterized protein n=1 Tax=Laetiporus sulphureus 93-53 TaxID=1314785 RepID=A0A165CNE1_9APHY|nr:uncharacterized protein LAESUDRAFT_762120 [Laetiporus sulphureus 93-53]KZT03126.1 hypothetical protein LAESUDRAFT_762120 [Laetiporus sulphureus 93-53]